jgi:putative tricarboxylic transport membrane protein
LHLRPHIIPIIATACLATLLGCASDGSYPSRPITLVCPWSAGGGTDRVSRQIAAQLEGELGVPVNVVNATGGGGVTGHTRGILARPDGYTLTMMTAELNMLHWRGLTSITYRDCQPLMLANRDDAAVFVKDDAPWTTLADLEKAIRAAPGTLKASGTAQGGIWHLSLAGWLTVEGLAPGDVVWISINGATPSLQELMAGGVDMVCCSLPEAQSLHDAGEIRCLGVMARQRLAMFPEVPTFLEQGAEWTMGTWRGIGLPKGVPAERRDLLLAAMDRVVNSDDYLAFMENAGFNPMALPLVEFEETLAELDAQFGAILTSDAFKGLQTHRFGPMVFPALLGGLLAANALGLAVFRKLRRRADVEPLTKAGLARMACAGGAIVGYCVLAETLGFVATGFLVLFALLWQLRVRWYVSAPLALGVVAAVYQVFAVWLRVPLPLGWWVT